MDTGTLSIDCDLEQLVKVIHVGTHPRFKLCVNRFRKSDVITPMMFCIATWKSRSKLGQGHSSSKFPEYSLITTGYDIHYSLSVTNTEYFHTLNICNLVV